MTVPGDGDDGNLTGSMFRAFLGGPDTGGVIYQTGADLSDKGGRLQHFAWPFQISLFCPSLPSLRQFIGLCAVLSICFDNLPVGT